MGDINKHCPMCGAAPGERCKVISGDPDAGERPGDWRTEPHSYRQNDQPISVLIPDEPPFAEHEAMRAVAHANAGEIDRLAREAAEALAVERERTVAAVVDALQEAINACINRGEFDRADGLRRGLNFIEERFKPSAPGGEDGH